MRKRWRAQISPDLPPQNSRSHPPYPLCSCSAAGFAAEHKDVTTGGLVKALTQHVGKPMALRVARPAGEVVQLWITAQEASDGHHH